MLQASPIKKDEKKDGSCFALWMGNYPNWPRFTIIDGANIEGLAKITITKTSPRVTCLIKTQENGTKRMIHLIQK